MDYDKYLEEANYLILTEHLPLPNTRLALSFTQVFSLKIF